jgi:hypothetical protein
LNDPSSRSLEFASTGYPIGKTYSNGIGRLDAFTITLRRQDGQICDFRGLDHFMVMKFTCRVSVPSEPVFAR